MTLFELSPDVTAEGGHDRISETQPESAAIDPSAARRLASLFKTLSDPTRVRIISMLLQGEVCVTDLSEALEMSQSATSHQLSDMREMRLVRYRREGRRVFYSLDDEHVRDLLAQGLAHVLHS